MSPWASKPRGPVALGNVANHGCTLAILHPPPSFFPLSLRTVKAKRRLMVANCAARGSGVLGKHVCRFIWIGVDKDVRSSSSAYHYPAQGVMRLCFCVLDSVCVFVCVQ